MSRKRLTPQDLDSVALASFLERLRAFLASDPYWMHVLTMPGGRPKRKQVASMLSKLVFTIPHVESGGPLNREDRRKVEKWVRQEKASQSSQ